MAVMRSPAVYLDHNATAPVRPEVIARVAEVLAQPANPSSVHSYGRHAKKILEDSRKTIAEAISAFPNEVIFTACGTEANTLALKGKKVIASAVEHSSVLKHAAEKIPVDANGIVDLAKLDAMLGGNVIVSVMLANNETGVIQPIREVHAICKKHGALLHVDAVQALGKMPLEFMGDMMSIAAHKMGGAVGAAALVVRQDLPIQPLLIGGGQELNRRAGTENLAAIAGFAKAVELIDLSHMKKIRGWLDEMEKDRPVVFAKNADRLPQTSCITIANTTQEVTLMKLDLAGFAVSAGSACSSGRIEPSHVLLAMGVEKNVAASAIRISAGWNTTEDEIRKIGQALV
jgi:cysteine desulfurase